MAVVWRTQFFDDTIGKNRMSGWVLEHLKAGEVSEGWSVEGGHCQAWNVIRVQVKCAVREADQAKCFNSDGEAYPPRPDGAYSGDHNPQASDANAALKQPSGAVVASSVSVSSGNKKQAEVAASPTVGFYYCQTSFSTVHGPMVQYVGGEFTGPAGEWRDFNGPVSHFKLEKGDAWNQYLVSNYGPVDIYAGGSRGGCGYYDDKDSMEKSRQDILARPNGSLKIVQWP
jgi:hypothetical protein